MIGLSAATMSILHFPTSGVWSMSMFVALYVFGVDTGSNVVVQNQEAKKEDVRRKRMFVEKGCSSKRDVRRKRQRTPRK